MSERKTIIRTVGLKKHYTVGGNTVRALDGVDMSVLQGEFVCVAGRSGSGKSTMLNMQDCGARSLWHSNGTALISMRTLRRSRLRVHVSFATIVRRFPM